MSSDLADVVRPVPGGPWTVLDYLPDAVLAVDADGRLVHANPRAEALFGRARDEARGLPLAALLEMPDRAAVSPSSPGLPRGASGRRPDGTRFPVEVTRGPGAAGDGGFSLVTVREVRRPERTDRLAEESEGLFRATFNQAAVGITHQAPDGRWLRVNRRFCEITGYREEELLSRTFRDLTHPDDLAADEEALRRLLAGAIPSYSLEKRYVRPDGSHVWVSLTRSLERGPGGEPRFFVSAVQDITEAREAAAALQQQYAAARQRPELLETVLRIGKEVARLTDLPACLRRIHAAIREALGFDRVAVWLYESEGDRFLGTLGTDREGRPREEWDQVCVAETLREAIRDPAGFRCCRAFSTELALRPDHEMFGVEEHAMVSLWAGELPVGILCVDNLPSGRRFRAEQLDALRLFAGYAGPAIENARLLARARDAERKYRAIFDHAADGVFQVTPDGQFLAANAALARILGYASPEDLLSGVRCLPHDLGIASEHWSDWGRNLEEKGLISETEIQLRRRQGEEIWVAVTARAVRHETGALLYYEGFLKDVTDRRRAEQELRESHRRLTKALEELRRTQERTVEQERLRALGEMASGITHDFNNVLAAVLGFSELLLELPGVWNDRERVTRYLEMIHTAARDGATVVSRLREFYRQRNPDESFGPVDLNRLVRQTIRMTEPKWKGLAQAGARTVSVRANLAAIPPVTASEAQLREALTNLIFNAVDAIETRGTVVVRTRPGPPGIALLEVEDTGVGMTDDVRQRCLEPFFTTRGAEGTGLGLAMVYGIVQRHQGSMEVRSQPGRGTLVSLCLPIHQQPEPDPPVPEPASMAPPLRVLLVEDEALVRLATRECLARDGHQVETAVDGGEALRRLEVSAFDLVITDRAMPRMNGDQLALEIGRTRPGLPVILLTGFGDLMQARNELPPGVVQVLSKPVTLQELRKVVAAVVPGNGLTAT